MTNLITKFARVVTFFKINIWRIRLSDLPRRKAFIIRQVRIIILAIRGVAKDNCPLRASALTFYSLLSIVPVAAMIFGIAKGFGFEKYLRTQLLEKFPGQEEVLIHVIDSAHSCKQWALPQGYPRPPSVPHIQGSKTP